jgi:hypothetical protein
MPHAAYAAARGLLTLGSSLHRAGRTIEALALA